MEEFKTAKSKDTFLYNATNVIKYSKNIKMK